MSFLTHGLALKLIKETNRNEAADDAARTVKGAADDGAIHSSVLEDRRRVGCQYVNAAEPGHSRNTDPQDDTVTILRFEYQDDLSLEGCPCSHERKSFLKWFLNRFFVCCKRQCPVRFAGTLVC